MQQTNQSNEKTAVQQGRGKKTYIAPKLTRHGKVEEMTQFVPNPGPSQPTG